MSADGKESKRPHRNPVAQVLRSVKRDGIGATAGKLVRFLSSRASVYKSQKGQDRWVLKTLKEKRGGFFVDLAASDGITFNNSWVLENKYGWKGIAIEPNPLFVPQLKRLRNCQVIDVVVDCQEGVTPFRVDSGGAAGIVAEDTDNRSELRGDELQDVVITELPSKTLTQILNECGAPRVIDYLSLDVEGAEERVLRALDFDHYTFHCMTIERPTETVNKTLFDNGYRFVKNVRFDTFYVHESHPYLNQIEMNPFEQVPPKDR